MCVCEQEENGWMATEEESGVKNWSSSLSLLARYIRINACEQTKPGGKKGTTRRHKERSQYDGAGGGGKRGKRNAEADRRKISRGTHGRSVLVAGGWRIGRVAMAKGAGVFSGFGGVRPNGKPPFGKFVASATPNHAAVPEV